MVQKRQQSVFNESYQFQQYQIKKQIQKVQNVQKGNIRHKNYEKLIKKQLLKRQKNAQKRKDLKKKQAWSFNQNRQKHLKEYNDLKKSLQNGKILQFDFENPDNAVYTADLDQFKKKQFELKKQMRFSKL